MLKLFVLIIISELLQWSTAFAQRDKAGDQLIVPLVIEDRGFDLSFRFCPSDTISLNPPWIQTENSAQYETSDFYVLETELSIKDYWNILGFKGLEKNKAFFQAREDVEPEADEYGRFLAALGNLSAEEPILAVRLEDIVMLCNMLSVESTQQNLPPDTIEGRTIRLLSLSEWRRAAIGKTVPSDSKQTIFYNYLDLDKFSPALLNRFKTVQESLEDSFQFTGSPEDMYRILNGTYDFRVRSLLNEALRIYFSQTVLKITPPDLFKKPYKLINLRSSISNALNIYDLLNGASEWTLAATSLKDTKSDWKALVNEVTNPPFDPQNVSVGLVLAGGTFNAPLTDANGRNDDWKRITIWGGPVMDDGVPETYFASQFDEISTYEFSGIRIGLFRTVKPDWFSIVRNQFTNGAKLSDEVKTAFSVFKTTLREIGSEEEQSKIDPVIHYYESLGQYETNRKDLATAILSQVKFPAIEKKTKTKIDLGALAAALDDLGDNAEIDLAAAPKPENANDLNTRTLGPERDNVLYTEVLSIIIRGDDTLLPNE
jgi:hypothetical protein